MKFHHCHCQYIPAYILGNLVKNVDMDFSQDARLSLMQGKLSHDKRISKEITMGVFTTAQAKQKAKREVYDCDQLYQQRVKLVRKEGGQASDDAVVNTVYDHVGIVREYYKKILGRDSIDGLGMDLILNVHYGKNYMNAYWDGDEMTFGEGDGKIFTDFTGSLDVVAHELTHGVTQHTANLNYSGQSGALNEHFSDVFGSAIQQYANKQNAGDADWLVGNEIMGPTLFGEALRSMKAPGTAYHNDLIGHDGQPAHMKDYYSGQDDNQGVHINSGIPNRAFYLVAYDLGTDVAVRIWYHALQNLWPAAQFNDAAEIISESARALTKKQIAPEGATQTVRLAFKEVGLPA